MKWYAFVLHCPYASHLAVDFVNQLGASDRRFGTSGSLGSGAVDCSSCALSAEALAFSCFTELMKRMNQNFPHGGAMDTHFANMRSLIQVGPCAFQ